MIAYTIEQAAAETPLSADIISAAIKRGDLNAFYRPEGVYPLILEADLLEWIRTFPTEPRRSA